MKPTITVITPTINRPSLREAYESVRDQLGPDDQHVIVTDGFPITRLPFLPEAFAVQGPRQATWGAAQRQFVLDGHAPLRKKTTHVIFLDDDDLMLPGAIDTFKQCAKELPDKLILARFQPHQTGVLWKYPIVAYGNVGEPCICVPWRPESMGSFMAKGGRYENDFDFIESTVAKIGNPVWLDRVVQIARRLENCEAERSAYIAAAEQSTRG